jgi:trehalose 6-phosphate synthase
VLILSRFAGAAEELEQALIVNPYDIYDMAQVIRTALEMSIEERRARHWALMDMVERSSLATWCDSYLNALTRVGGPDDPTTWHQPEAIRRAMERLSQSVGRPPRGISLSTLAGEG